MSDRQEVHTEYVELAAVILSRFAFADPSMVIVIFHLDKFWTKLVACRSMKRVPFATLLLRTLCLTGAVSYLPGMQAPLRLCPDCRDRPSQVEAQIWLQLQTETLLVQDFLCKIYALAGPGEAHAPLLLCFSELTMSCKADF